MNPGIIGIVILSAWPLLAIVGVVRVLMRTPSFALRILSGLLGRIIGG